MRKSLGEKRKELSDDHIAEITKLYGEFAEGEHVKILPNEAFGFLRVTVERPLRLRWVISDEALTALGRQEAWTKLDVGGSPETTLRAPGRITEYATREGGRQGGRPQHAEAAGRRPPPWQGISSTSRPSATPTRRSSPTATATPSPTPTCATRRTSPSPPARSSGTRPTSAAASPATEYVDAVEQHLKTEVHPYVPDAWIDHTKTKSATRSP